MPLRESVRRPRPALLLRGNGGGQEDGGGEEDPGALEAWRGAPALVSRRRQLARSIRTMRPHELRPDAGDVLLVAGERLSAWASRAGGGDAYDERTLRVGGGEEEEELAFVPEAEETAAEAAARMAAAAAVTGRAALLPGPYLNLRVLSDAATAGDVGAVVGYVRGADGAPLQVGGGGGAAAAAARGWPRLVFETAPGAEGVAVLRLSNAGSTSLYYTWSRSDRGGVGALLGAAAAGGSAGGDVSRFYCAGMDGVALPGGHVDFHITFRAPGPGVYRETWALETRPPSNGGGGPLRVALRGAAVAPDERGPARAALGARLAAAAEAAAADDAAREAAARVRPPTPPPSEEEVDLARRRSYERANGGAYYTPERWAAGAALLAAARAGVERSGGPPAAAGAPWDGAFMSIEAEIERIGPPVLTEAEKAAEAVAAAAAAAAAAEAAAKAKKAPAKKGAAGKDAKGGGGGEEPAARAPLSPEVQAARARGELRARLAAAAVASFDPPAEARLSWAVVYALLSDIALAVPELAGLARRDAGLPPVPRDVEPPAEAEAPAKARRVALAGEEEEEEEVRARARAGAGWAGEAPPRGA